METGYVKYITDEEFRLILREAGLRKSEPFLICLKFMAFLGLRVSDATNLKTENISNDFCEVTYKDGKTGFLLVKKIPVFFRDELRSYVRRYQDEFREGFLFPPLHNRVSKNFHLQPSTFRHFFKDFRKKHGLDKPYYVTSDGKPLYRVSVHTLKHYCLYKVFKASGNDIGFTQTFSGHREMRHTLRYVLTLESRGRQEEVLEKAFGNLAVV